MTEDEYLSLDLMKPGTRVEVIGNVVMVKFDTEDDAIIFAEFLKNVDGHNVYVVSKENDNG